MNVNQEVRLNLSADGIPPRLFMPQGDANSRTIVATLWDGATPYNVPASTAVMVRFRKPDGTGGLYDATEAGTAVTASGNTVTAPVATQMLAVAGVVQAEIDIYGTGSGKAADRLATFRFAVEVAPSVYPDAQIISSDYFNLIAATISEAIEAAAKADLAKTAAQAAQSAAETAQSGAESAEHGAQAAQAAAENAKTAAQAAQQGAEAAQAAAEDAQAAAEGAKSGAQAAQQGAQTAQQGAKAAQAAAENAKTAAQTAQQGAKAAQDAAEDAQAAAASSAAAAAASAANAATSVEGAVKYNTPQTLTDAQKQQARDNINAPAPYEAGDNISITGRIITTKAFPCNPNLLDNWYFGNPVNQRGQTSWGITDTYTIDRWKIEAYRAGDKGVTLNNNSVTIFNHDTASTDGYIGIYQPLENKLAENTEITISVLTATGLCVFSTTVPENAATVRSKGFQNFTLYFYTVSGHQSVTLRCKAGQSESFYAVKLELGSQQTLAHQENGVWVLNEIPDYGEQLRRCQRYYYRKVSTGTYSQLLPVASNGAGNTIAFCLPAPLMRVNPSIQAKGTLFCKTQNGNVSIDVTDKELSVRSNNIGNVIFTLQSNALGANGYGTCIADSFEYSLSADL